MKEYRAVNNCQKNYSFSHKLTFSSIYLSKIAFSCCKAKEIKLIVGKNR